MASCSCLLELSCVLDDMTTLDSHESGELKGWLMAHGYGQWCFESGCIAIVVSVNE